MLHRLTLALLILTPALALAQGSSIVVPPAAQARPDAPVRLADIARLDGPDAQRLADTVLIPVGQLATGVTLTPDDIRAALDRAGVNWGRVTLRSGAVRVTPAPSDSASSPAATSTPLSSAPAPASPGAGTLRDAILARLQAEAAVPAHQLRAKFRAQDADLLATPTAGRTVDVQPTATLGPRVPVRVSVYDADRLIHSGVISVDLSILAEVAVATRDLPRRARISPGDIALESRWVEPGLASPAPDTLIGSETRSPIAMGEPISSRQVGSPIIVRRNEPVSVECISGSVKLTVKARAQSQARDGELVEFRVDGARRSFFARMNGPGRAVMTLGGAQ